MGIREHPKRGTIVICDYDRGFVVPEMVKRRPAIVISPKIAGRPRLCTVVPLSTTAPETPMQYHCELELPFALPAPFTAGKVWVKGDMVNAVSLDRLDFMRLGKDAQGKRRYLYTPIGDECLDRVMRCVLNGLGVRP